MQLKTAQRKNAKIKLAIQGASGTGKTYSSLLLAYGLCANWEKIAIIDSENGSANLYSNLGAYKVLDISQPFTPEKYQEALLSCSKENIEVIIIDSMTAEWSGIGGVLDIHSKMPGNSFTNWGKVTPRHNAFISLLLQIPIHVIATLRTKQEYVLQNKDGKIVPEKVGLKAIQRDDTEYEFTVAFCMDCEHNAYTSKDRTGLFGNNTKIRINAEVGSQILQWCNNGPISSLTKEQMMLEIESTETINDLLILFKGFPNFQEILLPQFTKKRTELEHKQILDTQNLKNHGTTNIEQ